MSSDYAPNRSQSTNLYLVTFLATLFLLLCVSCGIVLRSFILRRRYQRRLEDALASGMLLAPRSVGSKRTRLGAKPAIFDSWIADGGHNWVHINPVAAQPVFVMRKYKGPLEPEQPTPSSTSSPNPTRSLWHRLRAAPNDDRAHDDDHPAPTQPPSSPSYTKYRTEMLQVSVLISMPSQERSRRRAVPPEVQKLSINDEEEEPLPDMALGVTRVFYRHPKPSSPQATQLPPSEPSVSP